MSRLSLPKRGSRWRTALIVVGVLVVAWIAYVLVILVGLALNDADFG